MTDDPMPTVSWRTPGGVTAPPDIHSRAWRVFRDRFMRRPENQLCRMCQRDGRVTAAVVCDHIIPHREDRALFWDESNLQPLCRSHHNITKQRQEKTGRDIGVDENGRPLSPDHPWNKS